MNRMIKLFGFLLKHSQSTKIVAGYRTKFDEKMAALSQISLSTNLAARPR